MEKYLPTRDRTPTIPDIRKDLIDSDNEQNQLQYFYILFLYEASPC